ncbi:MAG TPA: CDP-alcohol phosphatidyltransferase family protein, partial [Candidatus Xenobia bacterium]
MPLNIACWVTIFNMSCGFFAIMLEMANQSHAGLLMLLLAFVGDGLDGMLARKHNCASTFGENLDSLSDVIAFGV